MATAGAWRAAIVTIVAVTAACVARAADPPSQPNVLWISAEDLSASTVGCYGGQARTPRIDELASRGILFERAYAGAPVCAPSRCGIITGIMPTTLGSTPMRCVATPPDFLVGFPRFLRDERFCTNNAKTDYNLPGSFDAGWNLSNAKAHWRDRGDPSRPFFAVFNLSVTHESGLFADDETRQQRTSSLPIEARRDPAGVRVPPYYPDTLVVRRELAHRLELAALLDREVGRVLDELEQDGLADDTIVFFWSDHGEGIPRGKRSLTEQGLRVPLIVRVPERFGGLASPAPGRILAPGSRVDTLVSLIDLGPTVLDLAGVAIPPWMEGRSFLGPHAGRPSRSFVVGVRDRMDEREGLGRSVTDGRHRYVRNLLPWVAGDDLPSYADRVAITPELRKAAKSGTAAPGMEWFTRRSRPVEELYDLEDDPDELVNLAGDPAHAATLGRLREECIDWMRETRDTGVLPAAIMRREAVAAGSEHAIFHPKSGGTAAAARHERLRQAMFSAGEAGPVERFAGLIEDDDPAVRFWAACGAGWSGAVAVDAATRRHAAAMLHAACRDPDPIVAVSAARWTMELDVDAAGEAAGTDVLVRQIGADDPETRRAALVAAERIVSLRGSPDRAGRLVAAVAAMNPAEDEEHLIRLKKRIVAIPSTR